MIDVSVTSDNQIAVDIIRNNEEIPEKLTPQEALDLARELIKWSLYIKPQEKSIHIDIEKSPVEYVVTYRYGSVPSCDDDCLILNFPLAEYVGFELLK